MSVEQSSNHAENEYETLRNKWSEETACMSSVSSATENHYFSELVALGQDIIPLLLQDLQKTSDHFLIAILKEITHESPSQKHSPGNMSEYTKIWLEWGIERGYLQNSD